MPLSFWIPMGACAWVCASLGTGVLASRVAALATDASLLMWRERELVAENPPA
jgi:hypothetical protein